MKGEPLALHGCAPTPLASYLKALGALRLVSSPANHVSGEAADPHARGWWENECFHLRTTLSRDAFMDFFLHKYAPSPIIAPWNGRAGFLEGDAGSSSSRGGADLMRAIEDSRCRRLALMRSTIVSLRGNDHLVEYDRLRALAKRRRDASKTLKGKARGLNDEENKNQAEKEAKQAEKEARQAEQAARVIKSQLLPNLRSKTTLHHVDYVDACYVLAADEVPAPLLGLGGSDGSREFGVNFAENLRELIDFDSGCPSVRGRRDAESALFDEAQRAGKRGSMGQFGPGQGGPNATTGYEGRNPLNAWEIVLAMEGTLAFTGALTRRWGATGGSRAAFPFTFDSTRAGTGALSSEDPTRHRGEVWTPLWSRPAGYSEIASMFLEGRLTLGGRTARTGLDAARSVARVGVARGIEGFERYSLIQPDRKLPYQATPLGRFNTPDRPRRDLVLDLEEGHWLGRARVLVANRKKAPARARQAMRRLEDAFFQMAAARLEAEGTRSALVALGGFVGWLSSNRAARKELGPPPVLSSDWVRRADDGSAEYRIAAAVAAVGLPAAVWAPRSPDTGSVRSGENAATEGNSEGRQAPGTETDPTSSDSWAGVALPLASHLAPLDEKTFLYRGTLGNRRAWVDGDAPPSLVWGVGPLISNLIAVLERRLVDASARSLADKPLSGVTAASLSDVAAFLAADFDDARCAALLAGLVWARPVRLLRSSRRQGSAPLPFAYAALKPIFSPDAALRAAGAVPASAKMPVPPGLVARLRAGGNSRDGQATDSAVRVALARARASGLPSPFLAGRATNGGGRMGAGVQADRLAAALLIPIADRGLTTLLDRAYPGALPSDDNPTPEDTNHGA